MEGKWTTRQAEQAWALIRDVARDVLALAAGFYILVWYHDASEFLQGLGFALLTLSGVSSLRGVVRQWITTDDGGSSPMPPSRQRRQPPGSRG